MTSLIRRLRTRIACFLVLPLGQLACVVDAAGVIVGDLGEGCGVDGVVDLPVASGLSRWRALGPEDASMGAVPLWRGGGAGGGGGGGGRAGGGGGGGGGAGGPR